MRWSGHVARIGEGRNLYRVLEGKSEGKRPLGRPRRTMNDEIKIDLREISGGEWSGFTRFRMEIVGVLS
jgi:hypothetical protein